MPIVERRVSNNIDTPSPTLKVLIVVWLILRDIMKNIDPGTAHLQCFELKIKRLTFSHFLTPVVVWNVKAMVFLEPTCFDWKIFSFIPSWDPGRRKPLNLRSGGLKTR